jgi:hypothetical protein
MQGCGGRWWGGEVMVCTITQPSPMGVGDSKSVTFGPVWWWSRGVFVVLMVSGHVRVGRVGRSHYVGRWMGWWGDGLDWHC